MGSVIERVTGYQVPVRCKHCGKWHYGKSKIDRDTAERDAKRLMENCRKERYIMGLPDELTEADNDND